MNEVVYFIAAKDRVKIGRTTNLRARLSSLQIANPAALRLIGAIPGGPLVERSIQKELAAFAVSGEWFELNGIVERTIRMVLDRGGVTGSDAVALTDPRPTGRLDEKAFVARAGETLDELMGHKRATGLTSAQAMAAVAADIGVNFNTLWCLKYRPPLSIGAAAFTAIISARELAEVGSPLAGEE